MDENPYLAAQKFIDLNELPQTHLEQVADFMITNSKSTGSGSSQYYDPFTGGNRYCSFLWLALTCHVFLLKAEVWKDIICCLITVKEVNLNKSV